ncbi:RidA family protein [Arenicella xantha]|uniref:Enamine deaminase RidA (YjgF/YER057c/UK114 family) n=1 Tax=Arenicella xantha TaxID=644221 RepID=A0A395JPJ7_9GAMM|nr:Rid family hydrolase [Arenicella xantha]RBP53564.1 enamine deaminase RidA (YjgF/YER057c/UK114 family) [Arenicella xantha]
MSIEKINPEELYASVNYGFSHAVKSDCAVTIHCSGQVAWDKDYNVVGQGDVGAQARQALANLNVVLAESGASVSDIVRIRTYVVNHDPSLIEPIGQALGEFWGDVTPAANTWIGVQALAMPDFLIEIEATAQINAAS